MNPHLQRAMLLFDQSRYELAEEQLRRALADEPDEPHAHALLGMCLAERKQYEDATHAARQAILLAPDYDFAHYAMAIVLNDRNRPKEALTAVQEAIRLDSTEPAYFALLASIHLGQRRWQEALEAADQGLRLDAENVACTNLRAMALVKLGRRAEASEAVENSLAKSPENAFSHANQGWTILESGERDRALEHFREALRLDPENEWARRGIVEALKARHLVYSLVLRYFLWMSRLSVRAQWGVLLGFYFGNRLLGGLARSSPELALWLLPVRILLFVGILLTWTADPLFNLLLRLNRFGRLALSREQIVASNYFGLCVSAALVSLALCFAYGWDSVFLNAAFVFGFLMIPVSATFRGEPGWPRTVLTLWTIALVVAGVTWLVLGAKSAPDPPSVGAAQRSAEDVAFGVFLFGSIAFMWGANLIIMQRPRR